jgi:tetratricopeptide (TPR) repeat protein
MKLRAAVLGGAALLLAAGAGGMEWWRLAGNPVPEPLPAAGSLPVPPLPPLLGDGARYQQCLAMLPADPQGAMAFTVAWQDGGEAAQHCRALAEIALGDVATGAQRLAQAATASQAPAAARAAVFGQAAEAWLMAGDAARAANACDAALALVPDDTDLLVERAMATSGLDRYAAARDDLQRALAIDPDRTDALVLLAVAWRHLGQLDLAEQNIDRAISIDPDDAEALLERGILRQRRNDAAGARGDWERAIALAPDTQTADLAEQNLALLQAGPVRQ